MNVRIFGAGALLAVGLAAGCGTSSEKSELVSRLNSSIQGGTTDTTHTFAVGVSQGGAICSGTLIAPNLVLTARHCIARMRPDPQSVDCANSYFDPALTSNTFITTNQRLFGSTGRVPVTKIFTPPGNTVCGADIAVLLLQSNVPAATATPVTPGVQYPYSDRDLYGDKYTAIGYGLESPTEPNSGGLRRIRQGIQMACIGEDPNPVNDCFKLEPRLRGSMTGKEFLGGDGTCQGDSGSGAYDQKNFDLGKPFVVGVLSRGTADEGNCVGALYTRVDSYRDLLITAVTEAAQRGGYPIPSWTQPGPPRGDAGADSGKGGGGGGGSGAGLGETCDSDDVCASGKCASVDGESFTCSEECSADNDTCPDGYSCQGGFCFAGDKKKPSTNNVTTTQQSGCAVSTDPGQPVPWHWIGLGAGAMVVLARRRKR
jgi:MYXO-CTERM domain-containing protein